MRATILDNHWLQLDNITAFEEAAVVRRFSATRPKAMYRDSGGSWDGVYRRYSQAKKRMNRAFLGELRQLCAENGFPLSVLDCRPPWQYKPMDPELIGKDFLKGITLEDYQVAAIRKGCKTEVGVFDVPTGGGKTEIIAGLYKAIGCPTVILADQRIVIDQIKARLELRDVVDAAGLFYAGETPDGEPVIIGSIQSLVGPSRVPQKPDRDKFDSDKKYQVALQKLEATMKGFRTRQHRSKQFQEIVRNCEMLIVDEADLATSEPYKYVFRYLFNGRRRYGMTGSAEDPDKPVENLIIKEHFGSVIYRIDRHVVEAAGRIVPIKYTTIAFDIGGHKKEASAFDLAVNDLMIHSAELHQLIAGVSMSCPADEGMLVLVERDDLGLALQEIIPNSAFIHGKTPKRRRDEVLRAYERRDLRVLIGGKILKRGLDLAGGSENLFIATGGKLGSNLKQQLGRAVRLNKNGYARVWDIFFLNNRYLYDHSRRRLKQIVALQYESKVLFPHGEICGEDFVRARFRVPKGFL